jgi:hypothetical protein
MLSDQDLQRLITATKTGNHNYYHGNVIEGVIESLEELVGLREKVEEIKDVLGVSIITPSGG